MTDPSMFCFAVTGSANPVTHSDIDKVLKQRESGYKFLWLDLEAPELNNLKRIAEAFGLDEEAIEDVTEGQHRPRLDEYDDHAAIVLYGALGPESETTFSPRKLVIFIGPDFIITAHNEPLITIERQRARMAKHRGKSDQFRPDVILHMLVDAMVDNYLKVTYDYQERLDDMEEESLDLNENEVLLSQVLKLRRDMLELRRLATSLREVLQPLVAGDLDYVSERISTDFIHVRDHLTLAIESIDNLRELLNGVRDNYHAALATRANDIMKTLTIFASLFLPLSLVAGIYGMNMPLYPSVDNPSTFWEVIFFMGVIILGMLGFFKHRKWF